jgi:hypothetical protein
VAGLQWEGAIGSVGAAFIGALAIIFKPWSDEAKLKRKQKKIIDLFIAGDPGTKGLIAKILPAPERMQAVEHACAENEGALAAHTERIGKVEKTAYEDHDVLLSVKSGLENLTREFVDYRKKNQRNGGDGPGFGDSLLRIEKALGTLPETESVHE